MVALRQRIRLVASSDLPVLVEGETGTGKELVARALHELSGRTGPLIDVNVATMQEPLADAELFGAERGAYTGAFTRRRGLVERADRGTLLLDEAAELEPWLQAKLLRVLEDGRVRPVGGVAGQRVNFRLIVTTQYAVSDLLARAQWRHDFFCRVAGFRLVVPPLRERVSDIPDLVAHLCCGVPRDHWSGGCLPLLQAYEWPGNVRQLLRVVQRALLLSEAAPVAVRVVEELLAEERATWSRVTPSRPRGLSQRALGSLTDAELLSTLSSAGTYAEAARRLGLSVRTLHRHMARLRGKTASDDE
jgi:DNA-binding NtrC family response regulator